jgi:hypothetical protein
LIGSKSPLSKNTQQRTAEWRERKPNRKPNIMSERCVEAVRFKNNPKLLEMIESWLQISEEYTKAQLANLGCTEQGVEQILKEIRE